MNLARRPKSPQRAINLTTKNTKDTKTYQFELQLNFVTFVTFVPFVVKSLLCALAPLRETSGIDFH
jgi:hypothetical protein